MTNSTSHEKVGRLGCLLITILGLWLLSKAVISGVWHFLRASWPTWGLLLLTLAFLDAVRQKKNVFYRAGKKVLVPITVALASLMALELLFGVFKSFFDAGRVSAVENTILKAHFAIKNVEDGFAYFIPIVISVSVVFLCLSVGNWRLSSGLTRAKDAFSFLSLVALAMSSFTFFGRGAASVLLDWETDQNQRWYKIALADEQRSAARLVASRELYKPLQHLDAASKNNFATFFGGLNDVCQRTHCFRGEFEIVLNPNDSASARRVIVEVTPRGRAIVAAKRPPVDWSTANLRRILLGKRITVRGWMMFDAQHSNAAENTAPGHAGNWRATAWEIHPVTGMQPARSLTP